MGFEQEQHQTESVQLFYGGKHQYDITESETIAIQEIKWVKSGTNPDMDATNGAISSVDAPRKTGNGKRHYKNSLLVAEFMRTFGQSIATSPTFPPAKLARMRLKLILEETWELIVAMWRRDMHGIADALIDILYVVYGMGHVYGLDLDAGMREVHRANMAKLGPDGKPIIRADGKILKPEGWTPPNLRKAMGL